MLQKGFWQKESWRLEGKSGPLTITVVLTPQGFWGFLLCVFIRFGTTWVGISWQRFLRKKNTKRSEMFWIFCGISPNTNRQLNLKQGRCCLPVRKNTEQEKWSLPNLRVGQKAQRKSTKNYRRPVWEQ